MNNVSSTESCRLMRVHDLPEVPVMSFLTTCADVNAFKCPTMLQHPVQLLKNTSTHCQKLKASTNGNEWYLVQSTKIFISHWAHPIRTDHLYEALNEFFRQCVCSCFCSQFQMFLPLYIWLNVVLWYKTKVMVELEYADIFLLWMLGW